MNPGEDFQYLLEQQVKQMQEKAAALTEALAEAPATVSSRDGSVTVTVEPNGALRELTLGKRSCELGPARLTAAIMETVRTAQRQTARTVTDSFVDINGDDETAELIRSFLPAEPDQGAQEPEQDFAKPSATEDSGEPEQPEPQHVRSEAAPASPQPASPSGTPAEPAPARRRARPAPVDEDDDEMRPW